ncbi:hypothetical protein T484DRAFT_3633536 [Baffinella frigidus]|nr:hypothetical protein T484DRAFT_3633536 [Cryptophyta sp. CCMP2293]
MLSPTETAATPPKHPPSTLNTPPTARKRPRQQSSVDTVEAENKQLRIGLAAAKTEITQLGIEVKTLRASTTDISKERDNLNAEIADLRSDKERRDDCQRKVDDVNKVTMDNLHLTRNAAGNAHLQLSVDFNKLDRDAYPQRCLPHEA